jgi:hypothetical protein
MIADLLKQLGPALSRFIGYQVQRVFRPQETLGRPAAAVSAVAVSATATATSTLAVTATSASIAALSNDIGLASEYERPIQWPRYRASVPSAEVLSDALYDRWAVIPGGHKWTHYFSIYREIFGPRHTEPLRVLEIGVLGGASLKLWRQYFDHPETIIVGIDINPECIKFDAPDAGIHVRIGSQIDAAFLSRAVKEFGPFDLIIDDGSHLSSHIITSFNHLFADGLADSGIYFVEDLHANYWHPWRDSKRSFLDVCKELLEHMHAHYRSASPGAFLVAQASDQPDAPLEVPLITTMIEEIRFFDSIVAIYKTRRTYVPHYLTTDE